MLTLLEQPQPESINAKDLAEGQLAIITKWTMASYHGMIVQRYKKDLIQIGVAKSYWTDFFGTTYKTFDGGFVRVLPKGTKLVVG